MPPYSSVGLRVVVTNLVIFRPLAHLYNRRDKTTAAYIYLQVIALFIDLIIILHIVLIDFEVTYVDPMRVRHVMIIYVQILIVLLIVLAVSVSIAYI